MVGGFLLVTAVLAPFLWIRPHYQPGSYSAPQPFVLHAEDTTFDDVLRLRGVAVESVALGRSTLQPGDYFWVHLEWELLQYVDEDWSVFIHLIDPILGQPIAQRDMYLGQGLLLTSWLEPGQRLVNSYQLQVPPTALAPSQLDLAVGLYNYDREHAPLTDLDNDMAVIAKIDLDPFQRQNSQSSSDQF